MKFTSKYTFFSKLGLASSLLSLFLMSTNPANAMIVSTKNIKDGEVDISIDGVMDFGSVFVNPDKKVENFTPTKSIDYQPMVLSSFSSVNVKMDFHNDVIKGGVSAGLKVTNWSQRAVSTHFYLRNVGDNFFEARIGSETAMGLKLAADGSCGAGKLSPLAGYLPSNAAADVWDGTPMLGARERPGEEKPRMLSVMGSGKPTEDVRITLGLSYVPDVTNVGSRGHNDLELRKHPLVRDLHMSITQATSLGAAIDFDLVQDLKLRVSGLWERGAVNLFINSPEKDKTDVRYILLDEGKYKRNNYNMVGAGASITHPNFSLGIGYQYLGDSFLIPGLNTNGGDADAVTNEFNEKFVKSANSNKFSALSVGGYVAHNGFKLGLSYSAQSNSYNNTFGMLEGYITYDAKYFTPYARWGYYSVDAQYSAAMNAERVGKDRDSKDPKISLTAYNEKDSKGGEVDFKKKEVKTNGHIISLGVALVF